MTSMMRRSAALALACSLGACATITRGTTTDFRVESTPPGAAVRVSTGFSCAATPCSFKMPRKGDFAVTVTKPGYRSATQSVRSEVAGAGAAGLAGNVLVGGIIGVGIDATSGAMNDLRPNPLQFTLEQDPAPATTAVAAMETVQ